MAELGPGQKAAARAAKIRRGELGLTQRELADKARIHYRTVQDFERGKVWPRIDKLAQLERWGLDWPVGHLTEYAAKHREREDDPSQLDQDIADIMVSNLHPDLKLRLVDRLRSVAVQKIRDELPGLEQRIAGTADPGEGPTEGREIA